MTHALNYISVSGLDHLLFPFRPTLHTLLLQPPESVAFVVFCASFFTPVLICENLQTENKIIHLKSLNNSANKLCLQKLKNVKLIVLFAFTW